MFYFNMHSRHMASNIRIIENMRGNLLLPLHGLLFPVSSKVAFICIITDRITHATVFVTLDEQCNVFM